ncbi:MAG: GtrA family protein [Nitrospirae bacterium]|nr:GtrA family protein [Nitrospirota bacterium]
MRKTKKEIKRFIAVGLLAVGTDLSVYTLLLNFLTHSPAKAVSFISGTIVAYLLNKYWTFEQKKKSFSEAVRFAALYASTLGVNVAVNKISLMLLPMWIFFAFLAATGTSTILNFLGQKFWVFNREGVLNGES